MTQIDFKTEHKIAEPEASKAKISEKLINLKEEDDVDGVWKTDSDKIYLFARNDPEKELWFHRLNLATAFDMVVSDDPVNKKKKSVEEHDKFIKAYLAYIHNVYEASNYPVLTDNQKNKEVSNNYVCLMIKLLYFKTLMLLNFYIKNIDLNLYYKM